jgi:hypothetical protein
VGFPEKLLLSEKWGAQTIEIIKSFYSFFFKSIQYKAPPTGANERNSTLANGIRNQKPKPI